MAVLAVGCDGGASDDVASPGQEADSSSSTVVPLDSGSRTIVSASNAVSIDLAPVDVAELEHRESLLRSSTSSPQFREVIGSYEAGTDWSGTLNGVILQVGDTWYICVSVLESLPLMCGAGVTLVGPGDEFAALGHDSVRSLRGTFDAETISFVPDL